MSQKRTQELLIAGALGFVFVRFVRSAVASNAARRIKKTNEDLKQLEELDEEIHGEE